MKKILLIVLPFASLLGNSQQFINSGVIEYEVRTNLHRMMGEGAWADLFKDQVPQFSNTYYHLTFNDNKALYKLDHKDDKGGANFFNQGADDEVWYSDYGTGKYSNLRFVFDNNYLLSGDLMKIKWKLSPNETRVIAGFNCRKATGIIFDSVYVFAFYTDEIVTSGGPMGLSGLPGMILGVTIPRLFISYVATTLKVNGVDADKIKPPSKGKKRDPMELKALLEGKTKEWGSWAQQQIWRMFL